MSIPKQKRNYTPPQTEQEKDAQTKADAQVDLMGDAAVDPQPLLDEENDAIAQEVKPSERSSQ